MDSSQHPREILKVLAPVVNSCVAEENAKACDIFGAPGYVLPVYRPKKYAG
jgi:hypothetical protein